MNRVNNFFKLSIQLITKITQIHSNFCTTSRSNSEQKLEAETDFNVTKNESNLLLTNQTTTVSRLCIDRKKHYSCRLGFFYYLVKTYTKLQLIYNFSHFSKKERNWKKKQEATAGKEDDGEEDPLHKLAQRREDKKSEIYTLIASTFFATTNSTNTNYQIPFQQ